jgi:alkanesulfonate monooxygenase SsuD/methylene tetrahydromethanopterin reductase-like flavin-dependent oxidoreductase (luciferase family)
VTNPSTRAPFVTVQTIASVDDVSNGRAWLGIGLGDQRAKHFITGADGAGFYIIFARTSGEVGDEGRSDDVPGFCRG